MLKTLALSVLSILLLNPHSICAQDLENHTAIHALFSKFKNDSVNTKCADCYNCVDILKKDSVLRSNLTQSEPDGLYSRGRRRFVSACHVLQKYQDFKRLDSILSERFASLREAYAYAEYSSGDSLLKELSEHIASWYEARAFHFNHLHKYYEYADWGTISISLGAIIAMTRAKITEIDRLLKL